MVIDVFQKSYRSSEFLMQEISVSESRSAGSRHGHDKEISLIESRYNVGT